MDTKIKNYKLRQNIDSEDFDIELHQKTSNPKLFAVVYGKQIDSDLDYGEACSKLGEAIMHGLTCSNLIK